MYLKMLLCAAIALHVLVGTRAEVLQLKKTASSKGAAPVSPTVDGAFAMDWVALSALFNATGGENWTDAPSNGWLLRPCHCQWVGVTCSNATACDDSAVVEIERRNKNLAGVLPSWNGDLDQGALPQLRTLVLTDNPGLTGNLPETWGSMVQIRKMWLFNNSLAGGLPEAFGKMAQITTLQLYDNLLEGALPEAYGNLSQMAALDVSTNNLTGSVPEVWGNMVKMTQLWMYSNKLQGSLPATFGKMMQLQQLYLFNNKFNSSLPKVRGMVHRYP
jgi:hypothetical protein